MPMVYVASTDAASLLQRFWELNLTIAPYGGKFDDLQTAIDRSNSGLRWGIRIKISQIVMKRRICFMYNINKAFTRFFFTAVFRILSRN